jgi:tRNA pseudouridine55 synthase
MGRRKKQGGPDGVLLVDKPAGPTSFDVIAKLRKSLGTRSLGHTGTLDPLASGLLVVLAGRFTRLSAHLTTDDKRYLARVTFGTRTSTDDREGEVIEEGDASALTEDAVRAAVAARVGTQEQVPPMYSAISQGGERLYEKARRGEQVEVPSRTITLHELQVIGWDSPHVDVDVLCSKGTYIRALARDLGSDLGVPAHLGGLRRTAAGAYSLQDATTLEDLLEPERAKAALRSGPEAIRGIPQLSIDEAAAQQLRHGQRPHVGTELPEETVGLAVCDGALVALVERHGDLLHVVRGFG